MKLIRYLAGVLIISNIISCSSSERVLVERPVMPVEPIWVGFTRQPVIKKIDNNFIVSDQFVERAAQQAEYLKRLREWKVKNLIP